MLILPIQSISEVDQPLFGANIYNLAQLKRSGFIIPDGIALTPPDFILKTVLEHTRNDHVELFEQRLTVIRETLLKTPIPDELFHILKSNKRFWFQAEEYLDSKALWTGLIDKWLAQLRSKIWRDGFSTPLDSAFSAFPIFFSEKNWGKNIVTAFNDVDSNQVLIRSESKLEVSAIHLIQDCVTNGNKKLYLPQFYQFILDPKPLLIGVSPYTKSVTEKTVELEVPANQERKLIRSSTKLFVNSTTGVTPSETHIDGILVEAERFNDPSEAIISVGEMALVNSQIPIIFRLPDFKDGDIQGSLRLINQKSLLDTSSSTLLFLRHKKSLLNISLGLPTLRSVGEYKELKSQLGDRGVKRGATLKFYLEFTVPENIISLDSYLKEGLDGIILDLDCLHTHLCGIRAEEGEFYKHQIEVLIKFLEPFFKVINKERVMVIAKGQLAIYPEVLDFLIHNGVYGVVINTLVQSRGFEEHLVASETRSLIKNLTDLSLN